MASAKTKTQALLNGMHTAGIFADPSIDGPMIGTLVAIVDRAKNLPNRKTIGKQDPYCAARLGKEAKKTTTDIRGGQTPKWDQELRFAVHDSPDYYQLKVSVFHDDKKTDLIGETWIDLRDIIVPGGGQNDLWRNLTFKGKYAGEVRMEITYYDSRPKPEKPAAKPKPVETEPTEPHGGTLPRKQIKRRPLPSDPFTGETPAAPTPDQAPTPPRASGPRGPKDIAASSPASEQSLSGSRPMPKAPKQHQQQQPAYVSTQSPLQAVEYNTNPAPVPRSSQPELPAQPPQAALPAPAEPAPQHTPRHERYESPSMHYDERDYSPRLSSQDIVDRAHHRQSSEPPYDMHFLQDPRHVPPVEEDRPPPPPAHRSRHNSGNSQDMVVRAAYDTPPKSANAMRQDVLRNEAHRMSFSSAYPGRPQYRGFESAPAITNGLPAPDDHYHDPAPLRHHSHDGHAEYRSMQPTVEDVPESPNALATMTNQSMSRTSQYDELGFSQGQSPAPSAQSMEVAPRRTQRAPTYEDAEYSQAYDQVPTPAPLNISGRGSAGSHQRGHSPQPSYGRGDEMVSAGHYSTSPRPVHQPRGDELALTGRGSASQGHYSTSPQPEYQSNYQPEYQPNYQPRGDEMVLAGREHASPAHYSSTPPQSAYTGGGEMVRHQPQGSPIATRDFAPNSTEMAPYHSRSQNQFVSQRSELPGTEMKAPGPPSVPASLVPGVDPAFAQNVSDRVHDERRQQRRYADQSVSTPTRGRQHHEHAGYVVDNSNQTYVPPTHDYRSSMVPYSSHASHMNGGRDVSPNPSPQHMRGRGPSPQPLPQHNTRGRGVSPRPPSQHSGARGLSPQPPRPHSRARGISPSPHHTIKRKSVSPVPPPSDHRRLSGVPFGPDSYDTFNPTASAVGSDISRPDPDEKIITHDGREIDPSDHLPMETWAPEPEPKGPKTPAAASVRSRESPAGAQPIPSSGRRQLRIRPQSQASPVTYNSDPYASTPPAATTPPAPGSGGRNRLQKRTQRTSALPSTSSTGSSPLAPISAHIYQDSGSDFIPPRPSRASTWDYPSENHAPQYGSSPGGMMYGGGGGPPIPAKLPLPVMSGAMPPSHAGGNESEWALMQEMSRIDIGAGRSRRHRHY